ncbi:MAG: hypothetical protein E6K30_11430 [Gammaproteobacteria bacterium]|nr:MAG: hypothetical protein E6K30_11430 [Gammaproteobacteria bacterium]
MKPIGIRPAIPLNRVRRKDARRYPAHIDNVPDFCRESHLSSCTLDGDARSSGQRRCRLLMHGLSPPLCRVIMLRTSEAIS